MSLRELTLALNRPIGQSEPAPVAAPVAAGPQPVLHAYTNAVMVSGALLVAGFASETLSADPLSLAGLFALAIVTSFFKLDLRLSSSSATMTLGYAAGFIGLITLGPHPTAIAVSAGIWTQCAYRSGLSAPMDLRRRLFSVACGVITVEAAGWTFAATGGSAERLSISSLVAPLAAAAVTYFFVNTGLVAGAVALSTGQKIAEVWHKNFLLSAPSYFISAAIVGLGTVVTDRGAYLVALLIVAPLLLTFFAYRAYLGRIAEEQERLRIARESELTDGLTGLRNRVHLVEQIESALSRYRGAKGHRFAVLFLDLDGFKLVNDSLGHHIGDQLLQVVARRLQDSLQVIDNAGEAAGHTLARLGGDEFVALLNDVGIFEAKRVADEMQERLARPFDLDGRPVYLSASIGIALGPAAYGTPEEVLRDADTAMYRAKSLGKARAEVFDASMRAVVLGRLQLDTDLRLAVERHEFVPYYQPIINLATGQLCGFEALLRWQHPVRGIVEPGEFISVMEENRFVVPVGRRIFTEVCQQLAAWQTEMPAAKDLTINVNFAGQQFLDPGLVEDLLEAVDDAGIDPGRIVLEITESTAIGTSSRAVEVLERARNAGLRIVLDDFGTGYSSLACLHELPISGIKLHRAFLTRERRHPAILKAIITLAEQLGLTVTAEGVETATQCEQLKRLGCDLAQGYLFARPMPAADAARFLTQTRSLRRVAAPAAIVKPAPRAVSWQPSGHYPKFGGFLSLDQPAAQLRGARVASQVHL